MLYGNKNATSNPYSKLTKSKAHIGKIPKK